MKSTTLLFSSLVLAVTGAIAQAAEPDKSKKHDVSDAIHQEKCGRWADHQNLKGNDRAEFVADCVRELRHPDKVEDGDED